MISYFKLYIYRKKTKDPVGPFVTIKLKKKKRGGTHHPSSPVTLKCRLKDNDIQLTLHKTPFVHTKPNLLTYPAFSLSRNLSIHLHQVRAMASDSASSSTFKKIKIQRDDTVRLKNLICSSVSMRMYLIASSMFSPFFLFPRVDRDDILVWLKY